MVDTLLNVVIGILLGLMGAAALFVLALLCAFLT